MRKKFLTAALLIVGIFFNSVTTHAEIKTYEGIGEYWITQGETHDYAKKKAKKDAERNALEQIYLYVESQSYAKNSNLIRDVIISIVAGLMYVTNTKYSITTDNGTVVIKSTVTAEIDSDEVPAAVERHKNEKLNEGK